MEQELANLGLNTQAAGQEITLWYLFMRADIVVKAVMILLLVFSVWCWTIIFQKMVAVRRMNSRADRFEEQFWSGGSLDDLYERLGSEPKEAMASVFVAGMKEFRLSADGGFEGNEKLAAGLTQRVERVMEVANQRAMERAEKGLTVLASVGSTAPFIGLFGTVWGIMNAFTAIAAEANTSLVVVAPGIAEALFATALGLFAAIPATAAYNNYSTKLNRFGDRLHNFADEFSAILSRYLDEKG